MIPRLLYRTLVPKKYLFQENNCIGTGHQLTLLQRNFLMRFRETLFTEHIQATVLEYLLMQRKKATAKTKCTLKLLHFMARIFIFSFYNDDIQNIDN